MQKNNAGDFDYRILSEAHLISYQDDSPVSEHRSETRTNGVRFGDLVDRDAIFKHAPNGFYAGGLNGDVQLLTEMHEIGRQRCGYP